EFVDVTEEHLPLLDNIAQKIQSNLGKIRYWQGKATLYRKGYEEDSGKEKWNQEVSVDFYSDYVQNNRLTITRDKKVILSDQEQPLSITGILLFNDLFYKYMTYDPEGLIPISDGSGLTVFKKWKDIPVDQKKKSSLTGDLAIYPCGEFSYGTMDFQFNFNPKVVVTAHSEISTMISVAESLAYRIRSKHEFKMPIRIKAKSNIVEIVYVYPNDQKSINTYDLSQGGHQIRRSSDEFGGVTIRTIDFEQNGDIWLPKKVYWKIRNVEEETILFSHQKINQKIPETFFTPINLGVKLGDSCYDSRIDKVMRITDSSFPEPEILDDIKRHGNFTFVRSICIAVGIVFIGLGVYFKVIKRKLQR
ncbi:MAG: outer membrane lipoprotein-sorting protein, partial [Planctomycetaceae bacterium]|nr:outer membrane lipoprotein-sorting protein [Planctomycetaceae bacterium]